MVELAPGSKIGPGVSTEHVGSAWKEASSREVTTQGVDGSWGDGVSEGTGTVSAGLGGEVDVAWTGGSGQGDAINTRMSFKFLFKNKSW